jgi:nucleoid-associated protein YgaU
VQKPEGRGMLKYLIIASACLAIGLGILVLQSGMDPNPYQGAVFVSATDVIDAPPTYVAPASLFDPDAAPATVPPVVAAVPAPVLVPRRIIGGAPVATPRPVPRVARARMTTTTQATTQTDQLRAIATGAFAGMVSVTPTNTAPASTTLPPTKPGQIQALIIQTLRQGDGISPALDAVINTVPRPARKPLLESTTYTVKPGDSLRTIALQYYGTKDAFVRIFKANRSRLSSPDSIRVGQQLKIPKS